MTRTTYRDSATRRPRKTGNVLPADSDSAGMMLGEAYCSTTERCGTSEMWTLWHEMSLHGIQNTLDALSRLNESSSSASLVKAHLETLEEFFRVGSWFLTKVKLKNRHQPKVSSLKRLMRHTICLSDCCLGIRLGSSVASKNRLGIRKRAKPLREGFLHEC